MEEAKIYTIINFIDIISTDIIQASEYSFRAF